MLIVISFFPQTTLTPRKFNTLSLLSNMKAKQGFLLRFINELFLLQEHKLKQILNTPRILVMFWERQQYVDIHFLPNHFGLY